MTGGDKELQMNDQDLRIFEKDLSAIESSFPERKDIITKTKLLIKDHIRLKELLSEENHLKDTSNLQSLLLAQVLEYETDRKVRFGSGPSVPTAGPQLTSSSVSSQNSSYIERLNRSRLIAEFSLDSVKGQSFDENQTRRDPHRP